MIKRDLAIVGAGPAGMAAAAQAAGGSLGVVIPPSIPMIIFGFLTELNQPISLLTFSFHQ